MSDDFDREERAFRDAFRASLEGESFRPLDAAELKASAPVRRMPRRWQKGLAVAAAVVLVAGGAGVMLPRLLAGSGVTASGSMAAAPAAAGGEAQKDVGAPAALPSSEAALAAVDWQVTAPSPLSARTGASVEWADGSFWVVGGREPQACAAGTDCPAPRQTKVDGAAYDPVSDTWLVLPDAPVVVDGARPVTVGTRLYYLGATDASNPAPAFVALDTGSRTWQRLAAPRESGRLVAAGDQVVDLGSGKAVGQLYDPATGMWSDLPADPWPDTVERSAVWADGRLLVFTLRRTEATKSGVRRLEAMTLAPSGERWEKLGTVAARGSEPVSVAGVIAWAAGVRDTVRWVSSSLDSDGVIPARSGSGLDGAVGVVAGDRLGANGDSGVAADLYDFDTGTWLRLTAPPGGSDVDQTVAGSPSGLLVVGGDDGGQVAASYLALG